MDELEGALSDATGRADRAETAAAAKTASVASLEAALSAAAAARDVALAAPERFVRSCQTDSFEDETTSATLEAVLHDIQSLHAHVGADVPAAPGPLHSQVAIGSRSAVAAVRGALASRDAQLSSAHDALGTASSALEAAETKTKQLRAQLRLIEDDRDGLRAGATTHAAAVDAAALQLRDEQSKAARLQQQVEELQRRLTNHPPSPGRGPVHSRVASLRDVVVPSPRRQRSLFTRSDSFTQQHRLFIRLESGRLVPVTIIDGGELCSVINKAVCRLLMQHQVQLDSVFTHYADGGTMTGTAFVDKFATAFALVPSLCSRSQLQELFDSVNWSEVADADTSSLNLEEFTEALCRLALFYAGPADLLFDGSREDLVTNPNFAVVMHALLRHMDAHKPAELRHLEFLNKVHPPAAPVLRRPSDVGAGAGAGAGSGAGSGDGSGDGSDDGPGKTASDGAAELDRLRKELQRMQQRDALLKKHVTQTHGDAQKLQRKLRVATRRIAVLEAALRDAGVFVPPQSRAQSVSTVGSVRAPPLAPSSVPGFAGPAGVVFGGRYLSTANRQVNRLLLQQQAALQAVFTKYAAHHGDGDEAQDVLLATGLVACLCDAGVVPALCAATDANALFASVNTGDVDVRGSAALEMEEFLEVLARLSVVHPPTGFAFDGTAEEVAGDANFPKAFETVLKMLIPELQGK